MICYHLSQDVVVEALLSLLEWILNLVIWVTIEGLQMYIVRCV